MSRNHGHSGGLARFLVRPGQYSFVRAGSSSARPGAPVVTFVPAYETEGPSLMANEDRVPLLSAAPNPASVAGAPAGAANSTASLFDALNKGDINAVRKMLDQGQPVNAKVDGAPFGQAPLFRACFKGHDAIARLLLQRGADPMQMDDRGQLPIHAAACSGSQIFWHLLELGCPIDARAGYLSTNIANGTILHLSACYGQVSVMREALERGVDLEALDGSGRTAFFQACWAGEPDAAKLLLEKGAAWDLKDKDGGTAFEHALSWQQSALLDPFLECPHVLFSPSRLAAICGRIVDAVGPECRPALVVSKFPSFKLHCALHLARLLEESAKVNPDQASLILEHRDEAIETANQLLDAMGQLFVDRLQRRALLLEGEGRMAPWISIMESCRRIEADEKKLPDRLHKCTELTKNDVLDTWHAEQVYERQMKKIEQEPAFSKALDQEGPLFDSVDILEHRLPGIGSPLDIAIELNLYSFMVPECHPNRAQPKTTDAQGHPFVHRYIQRISESASEMQAVSLLPSVLVSLVQKVFSSCSDDKMLTDKSLNNVNDKEQDTALEPHDNNVGKLWWEMPGHPLNSWKGKFAADLTTYIIFLLLIALGAVSNLDLAGHGEHGKSSARLLVLALLAIQAFCMLLREFSQAREEGIHDYFSDIFNLFDLALFLSTPLLAILGIVAEVVSSWRHVADTVIPILALVFIPASLRLLEFGYVNPMFGPMLVVFGRMVQNVFSVLIVFVVVFVSFMFAVWGWSTSFVDHSNVENSDMPTPITLLETAGSLYYAILGESDYDLMRTHVPFVGPAFFSIYQIMTVILLLNVLTGLFSFTFTDIFTNSKHVHAFGRAKIILRYHRMDRRLVAPLNLIWLLLSPTPRLAQAFVNVISAVVFLPFLLFALGISYLSRSAPDKKKEKQSTAQLKALTSWLKAIEFHRKARLANPSNSTDHDEPDPDFLVLKYPLAYNKATERPDPLPPGPLKLALTVENLPRNLEAFQEQSKEELQNLKAGQEKLEASLAELKASLSNFASSAHYLFKF